MGATDHRPTPEPDSSPEGAPSLDLRILAQRTLRLLASRYRLLALCVCIGALTALTIALIRRSSSPSPAVFRAQAVLQLQDSPLVLYVPKLALPPVANGEGMRYEINLARSARTFAPAANALGTTSNVLSRQVIVSNYGAELHFETELPRRERARRTIAAVAASFRSVREADFVHAVARARARLVHAAKTAQSPLDRKRARTEIGYADALLSDRAAITRGQSITVEALRPRSMAEATFLGAVAGAVSWLLVLSVLALRDSKSVEGWSAMRMRRPLSGRRGPT